MIELNLEGADLRVLAGDGRVRSELIDVVVDLDEFGSPLGLEILGLFDRYPGMARRLRDAADRGPRVSVDEDADAIYVELSDGRSFDQMARLAAIAVSDEDELLAMHVRLEP